MRYSQAGTDSEAFITPAHATGRFYDCAVLPDFLNGEASYALTSIGSAGGNYCKNFLLLSHMLRSFLPLSLSLLFL